MLYVFGGDTKSREKMRKTLEALQKRAPLAHVMRVTDEDAEGVNIEELLSAQGLFYTKRIVVFDNALKEKIAQKKIIPHLKTMAQSEHVFLVLEETPHADILKKLTAHATKSLISESAKKKKDETDWSATNALEARDSKRLWLALTRAQLGGVASEMTHGQLFWKAKQMLLERRFRKWNEGEAKKLIGMLAELPHRARRRGVELEYALERFALEI
jgi:hypothetical protein